MPKTISKRITSSTGKRTSMRRLKNAPKAKSSRVLGSHKSKKTKTMSYSIENDPMAQLLIADGFREMTDAEYEEVRPYLKPRKTK